MRQPICLLLAVLAIACLTVLDGGGANAAPAETASAGGSVASQTPLPSVPAAPVSHSTSQSKPSAPVSPALAHTSTVQPAGSAVVPAYPGAANSSATAATASGIRPTQPDATLSSSPAPAVSGARSGLAEITAPVNPAQFGRTPSPAGSTAMPAAAKAAASDHALDHTAHLTAGEILYDETDEAAHHNPFNWSVYAYKSRYELEVLYQARLFKRYHAVFGRNQSAGAKEWEGDRRTPEGNYLIIAKRRSELYRWFLKINYPNAIDHARFERLKAEDEIPRWVHEGGAIGIHGTDTPLLNVSDIDWTTGCISVGNADISQLARLLPIGTLVVIKP